MKKLLNGSYLLCKLNSEQAFFITNEKPWTGCTGGSFVLPAGPERFLIKPRHEKTCLREFATSETQTDPLSSRD